MAWVGGGNGHGRLDAVVSAVAGIIEEGVKPVVLVVGDRVVLVGVALGTHHRQPKPGGGSSRDAVLDGFRAVFFRVTAAFIVDFGVAIEAGGDFLVQGSVRQEIAGKLLDRESVKGHVVVERVDDPIPIRPNRSGQIDLITVEPA
ncbi:MAG: hypothetical protein U1G07_15950 [Verrucomicrobiota bacterium]